MIDKENDECLVMGGSDCKEMDVIIQGRLWKMLERLLMIVMHSCGALGHWVGKECGSRSGDCDG